MPYGVPIRSWSSAALCGLICLGMAATAATQDTSAKKAAGASSAPASGKHSTHKASTKKHSSKRSQGKARSKRKRGQQVIDSPRARQIQEALIREHYMRGEPSGKWDASTQDALKRYQAAQGWQSKTVPDSRALIKLGLGPSKDGLLNPDSAMTTELEAKPTTPSKPASESKPQH